VLQRGSGGGHVYIARSARDRLLRPRNDTIFRSLSRTADIENDATTKAAYLVMPVFLYYLANEGSEAYEPFPKSPALTEVCSRPIMWQWSDWRCEASNYSIHANPALDEGTTLADSNSI